MINIKVFLSQSANNTFSGNFFLKKWLFFKKFRCHLSASVMQVGNR
jgi:hypothetical protein